MRKFKHPLYKHSQIANYSSLAAALLLSESDLRSLIDRVNDFYKPGKLLFKKDGKPRETHNAKEPLKSIHGRILNRILKKVDYPSYMLGGIADKENPRSPQAHAAIHTGKKILISEDISDFFPSTTYEVVKGIWQYCFNFSPEVAEALAKLTTYKGELPQGWRTSGYLANLVFWDNEPSLVKALEDAGYQYSRYMDDVTVSAKFRINNKEKQQIIANIYGTLYSKGYKPKRKKHEITCSSEPMKVTSLNVNGKQPSISKTYRNNVRAAVFQLERRFSAAGKSISYYHEWRSVYGKVCRIKAFHCSGGSVLQKRMNSVKPPKQLFNIKR